VGNEAARLQAAIQAIERIVEHDGPSRFAMANLARLHALRALALAGSGACSEALVEIAMAIDHDSRDEQFQRTCRHLTYQMEAIRQEAAAIRHVDPRVNPDDLVLVSEARRGFEPMKLYQSSRRAVQTRALAKSLGPSPQPGAPSS
jgi:hypothetical protein